MRPEHRFSKELTKTLEAYGVLVLSIETGPTNRGVPDLFIAKQGASLWIELKVVSPLQQKEPRTAIQIKRQSEMINAGLRVLNAHDVRDAKDFNVEYRLKGSTPHSNFITIYGLASAILSVLAE